MRNDMWFRVHYPYGIVLDVENQTFALFNRFYKRLGEGRDVEFKSKNIPQLLNFIPNKNVTEELRRELEALATKNDPIMYSEIAEGRFFRVWFYNDATNPYAYAMEKCHVVVEKLFEIFLLLPI